MARQQMQSINRSQEIEEAVDMRDTLTWSLEANTGCVRSVLMESSTAQEVKVFFLTAIMSRFSGQLY